MALSTRRAGAIAWAALLLVRSISPWRRASPAAAGLPALAAELLDPVQPFERRAEAALERWRPRAETDDEPANAENAEPIDAYDGLYVGMVTTRADGRLVTFKLKVTQRHRRGNADPARVRCDADHAQGLVHGRPSPAWR